MGLWEYIKKSLNLGADDMVMVHEVPMDSFRATDTTHTMRSGKYWPFKKMFMSADGRMPNGFALEPNGKITNPHVYDSVMGDAIRTMPMMKGSAGGTLWSALEVISRLHPDNTVGGGFHDVGLGAPANPDEWKWGRVAITAGAGGATADTELVATVAGKKIQISILGITALALVDAAANTSPVITIQDSDNVTLSGAAVIGLGVTYCNVVAAALATNVACRQWDLMRGPVAYSATANRAIEADLAGCTQNDVIELIYAWREFA